MLFEPCINIEAIWPGPPLEVTSIPAINRSISDKLLAPESAISSASNIVTGIRIFCLGKCVFVAATIRFDIVGEVCEKDCCADIAAKITSKERIFFSSMFIP